MCGRYRASASAGDIEKLWKVPANETADAALDRREVRPTTTVAIVRAGDDGPRMEAVRWGVQPEWSRRPLLNARSDKLASSRLWKRLAADPSRRVLFIADAWYEWLRKGEQPNKGPKPAFTHLVNGGEPFAMAGLLDVAQIDGQEVPAATIVTTDAAGPAADLHDRMPVVFPDDASRAAWLSDTLTLDDVDALCVPLTGGVTLEPVELGGPRPRT
jgi:putative SOS response-associated peptidase YedK